MHEPKEKNKDITNGLTDLYSQASNLQIAILNIIEQSSDKLEEFFTKLLALNEIKEKINSLEKLNSKVSKETAPPKIVIKKIENFINYNFDIFLKIEIKKMLARIKINSSTDDDKTSFTNLLHFLNDNFSKIKDLWGSVVNSDEKNYRISAFLKYALYIGCYLDNINLVPQFYGYFEEDVIKDFNHYIFLAKFQMMYKPDNYHFNAIKLLDTANIGIETVNNNFNNSYIINLLKINIQKAIVHLDFIKIFPEYAQHQNFVGTVDNLSSAMDIIENFNLETMISKNINLMFEILLNNEEFFYNKAKEPSKEYLPIYIKYQIVLRRALRLFQQNPKLKVLEISSDNYKDYIEKNVRKCFELGILKQIVLPDLPKKNNLHKKNNRKLQNEKDGFSYSSVLAKQGVDGFLITKKSENEKKKKKRKGKEKVKKDKGIDENNVDTSAIASSDKQREENDGNIEKILEASTQGYSGSGSNRSVNPEVSTSCESESPLTQFEEKSTESKPELTISDLSLSAIETTGDGTKTNSEPNKLSTIPLSNLRQNEIPAFHQLLKLYQKDPNKNPLGKQEKSDLVMFYENIHILLNSNTHINALDDQGNTPLHVAIQVFIDWIELLKSDKNNSKLLHLNVELNILNNFIFVLIKNGANFYLPNKERKRPTDILREYYNKNSTLISLENFYFACINIASIKNIYENWRIVKPTLANKNLDWQSVFVKPRRLKDTSRFISLGNYDKPTAIESIRNSLNLFLENIDISEQIEIFNQYNNIALSFLKFYTIGSKAYDFWQSLQKLFEENLNSLIIMAQSSQTQSQEWVNDDNISENPSSKICSLTAAINKEKSNQKSSLEKVSELFEAALKGNSDYLNHHSNGNTGARDDCRQTLLHYACKLYIAPESMYPKINQQICVSILSKLDPYLNFNACDNKQETPLHIAVKEFISLFEREEKEKLMEQEKMLIEKYPKLLFFLINMGSNFYFPNFHNQSPFDLLKSYGEKHPENQLIQSVLNTCINFSCLRCIKGDWYFVKPLHVKNLGRPLNDNDLSIIDRSEGVIKLSNKNHSISIKKIAEQFEILLTNMAEEQKHKLFTQLNNIASSHLYLNPQDAFWQSLQTFFSKQIKDLPKKIDDKSLCASAPSGASSSAIF